MNKLQLIAVCILALSGFGYVRALTLDDKPITHDKVVKALGDLDAEFDKRDVHIRRAQAGIDSVKRLMARDVVPSRQWLDHVMEVAHRYTSFNNDSLLYYLRRGGQMAREEGLDSLAIMFELRYYTYLPLRGSIEEAVSGYEQYSKDNVPPGLMWLYYAAGKQMYSYVAAFYENQVEVAEHYAEKSIRAQEGLIASLKPGGMQYTLNQGELLLRHRRYKQAKEILLPLLDSIPVSNNYYARACYFLADIAKVEGDYEGQRYYLARSALSDAVAPTLEMTALQELGQLLFKDGDIDRAYRYLIVALVNAVDCHAILRQIQTSQTLPTIQQANQSHEQHWRMLVYIIIAILAVVVVVLVATLLVVRRQMKRMKLMQINLRRANKTREIYINQFLTLCAVYIEKLKHYNDLITVNYRREKPTSYTSRPRPASSSRSRCMSFTTFLTMRFCTYIPRLSMMSTPCCCPTSR